MVAGYNTVCKFTYLMFHGSIQAQVKSPESPKRKRANGVQPIVISGMMTVHISIKHPSLFKSLSKTM